MDDVSKEFKDYLKQIEAESLMTKEERNGKLMRWLFRNTIMAGVIWYFWESSWVNIVLWIVIPVATISLLMTLLYNPIIRWRLNKTRKEVNTLKEELFDQSDV